MAPRILFLVTEDWFFRTHRLSLASACHRAGAEVYALMNVSGPTEDIESHGIKVIPWNLKRGGLNPYTELKSLLRIVSVYRKIRPNLVHHFAIKPVLYGGIAARLLDIPAVNAVTGLGFIFTAGSSRMRLLARLLLPFLKFAMNRRNAKGIVQNPEDRDLLVTRKVLSETHCILIRGSGVDVQQFQPSPEKPGSPVVVLASRLLWNKGVGIFVEAAQRIKQAGYKARFVLVGEPDLQNPGTVSREQLQRWHDSGVEWWGQRQDMPAVFADSTIVCFPSYYGEGVPKVLLEAAASGRAVITTNSPGCREAVRDGENGILVPMRDAAAVANAVIVLLNDPELRRRMGERGREIVLGEFSCERVIEQTMSVYRSLLLSRWPSPVSPEPLSSTSAV